MIRLIKRWPAATWLLVYLASVFILMGSRNRPGMLIAGIVLAVIAFGAGVWLATRPAAGRPRPPLVWLSLGGVAAFYIASAVIAAFVDPAYAVATLLAGIIPGTAVALWLATARQKTVAERDRLVDASAEADSDPLPGMGLDDETPLGDTTEHSDAEGDPWAERERRMEQRFERARRLGTNPRRER